MTEEKVLIDVHIDEADLNKAITAVKDARNQLDALKKAQKDLEEQGLKNTTMYIKNEAEIKKLNGTVSENTKVLTANTQIQETAAGSISQMRAQVTLLTTQYNNLSESERNNAAIGGKLQAQIRLLNDQMTNQKEKLGQTVSTFGQFKQGVTSAIGANQNLAVAQNAVNNVMKANPIILIVALLGQLFNALSKNEKIMDAIEPVMSAINEAFKVLGDVVIELAEPLIGLFENPMQALEDLYNFIKDNLINRVKAFGVIVEGIVNMDFKKMADGFIQAGTGIENATDKMVNLANKTAEYAERVKQAAAEAYELAQAQDALNEATLESNELAAKNQILMNQLDQTSRDKTASDKDRVNALKELNKLEDETFEAQLTNAREQQRILEAQAKNATVTEDQAKAISEARIKVYQLEADQLLRAEKNANRVKKLQEEMAADHQKATEKKTAQIEKEKAALMALEEFRLELNVKSAKTIEDRVKAELALEEFRRENLLANTELTESQRQLIIEKSTATITAINQKGIDDRKAADLKAVEDAKKALEQQMEDAFTAHDSRVQREINLEKEKYLNGAISKEQYEKELADLELAGLIMQQDINRQFGEEDLALNQQIIDAKIAQKEFETDQAIAAEERKFNGIKNIMGQAATLFNKHSVAYKALASAQTLMDTYQAAMAAYKSFAGLGPVGVALGAVAAAIVTAKGLQNVANINRTQAPQIPKAEHGIMLDIGGKDHSQGGTDIAIGGKVVANAQRGEKLVVMKREATPLLRSLSMINKMAGGIDFINDRRSRFTMADGGLIARGASSQIAPASQQVLIDGLSSAIKKINIITKISDLNRVNNQMNTSTTISELS